MSSSFRKWLIHTAVIDAAPKGTAATGEVTNSWNPAGTSICRFVAETQRYASEQGGELLTTAYMMYWPAGTSIQALVNSVTNITLTSTGGTVDSGRYKVLEVLGRNAKTQRHITTRMEKIH